MNATTPSSRSSNLLPNLATVVFYIAGFVLLGMMIMYVISRRSLYPLFNLGYLSNYWAIPLLVTASWLRTRNPKGWWLGMMLGGFFLLAGFSHVFGLMFALARGNFELESLRIPSISRFVFGAVVVFILSRPAVIDRIKQNAALTCPDLVRMIAASGFILGLYWAGNIVLSSMIWGFLGNSLSLFLLPFSTGWDVLPIVLTATLFPIGKALLRGRAWAYYSGLAFWGIAFAWSLVDVIVLVSKIARFGAWGMWLESPFGFLGVPVGGLLLTWLLCPDTLAHVGLKHRPQKRLALVTVVSAVILIALAKRFTVPVLSDIFLF